MGGSGPRAYRRHGDLSLGSLGFARGHSSDHGATPASRRTDGRAARWPARPPPRLARGTRALPGKARHELPGLSQPLLQTARRLANLEPVTIVAIGSSSTARPARGPAGRPLPRPP